MWTRVKSAGGLLRYWNRQGQPMSFWEWANGYEWRRYQVLVRENVGPFFVSTIWTGHQEESTSEFSRELYGPGPRPGLFETAIFYRRSVDVACIRRTPLVPGYKDLWRKYVTEEQAWRGHRLIRGDLRRRLQRFNGPERLAINGGPSSVPRIRT